MPPVSGFTSPTPSTVFGFEVQHVFQFGDTVPLSASHETALVLHTTEGHDGAGRPAMRHWGEVVLHTDSRAAALATRLAGGSAPRMAEQYVAQVQTFFAALAWRLDRVPAKKEAE